MKKTPGLLNTALAVSFFFGLSGLYLLADSYYSRLSATAAQNQLEFLKTIPFLVTKSDEPVKLPAYQENIILTDHPILHGLLYGDYFGGRMSVRQAAVKITAAPFSSVEMTVLLDARERK